MNVAAVLPYAIPLVIVVALFVRTRRERRLRPAQLWIVPLVVAASIGTGLYFQPHARFGPLAYAVFAAAFVAGIATGTIRARLVKLRLDPATGTIMSRTSSYAVLLLIVLAGLRIAATAGGAGARGIDVPVAIDASLLLALAMVVAQRCATWLRARAMLARAAQRFTPSPARR